MQYPFSLLSHVYILWRLPEWFVGVCFSPSCISYLFGLALDWVTFIHNSLFQLKPKLNCIIHAHLVYMIADSIIVVVVVVSGGAAAATFFYREEKCLLSITESHSNIFDRVQCRSFARSVCLCINFHLSCKKLNGPRQKSNTRNISEFGHMASIKRKRPNNRPHSYGFLLVFSLTFIRGKKCFRRFYEAFLVCNEDNVFIRIY